MRSWALRAVLLAVVALVVAMPSSAADGGQSLKFVVTLSPALQTGKVTGRLMVVISTTNRARELSQMNSVTNPSPFFGTDVSSWKPGTMQKIAHDDVQGYPLDALDDLPAGDYFVQAFFNVYTQFNRSDG